MIHSIRNSGIELFSGYYLQWVLLGGLVAIPALERRLHTPCGRARGQVPLLAPRAATANAGGGEPPGPLSP